MKNIIRINLDVNERNESNIGIPLPQKVIRSKDTAVIIEMRIIGYDVNDGYTFTLLSEYTKSKRHTLYTIGDRLKIEGNVVTFVPPAELISTLEIVTNTLYIEKSGVSLDFSKFHYLAQLSDVDNTVGPVKEVYDDNYQALIDELEFKYMLIEDLTAEYVAAQVAEARVGADGTIYRFLKERLDVEHQKVTAQVGEVSNRLELTNNEIIDARGGKPTLRVRLNEISRVDEYGKYWTLIDGEWEERVGQTQLINVRGEVAWAMAEAEQAREDAIKAYEDAVAEAKRSADIEDALIRNKIEQEISAVEEELSTAKQEAQNAYTDAVAEAEAKVQAKDEEYKIIFGEYDSTIETIEEDSQTAKTKAEQALTEAGISTDLAQTAKDLATTAQTNASTAISNASQAQIDASAAVSDASQAKADASQAQADAQTAITEAGEAVDSANTAKTNAQTALEDAQTALSTAKNADTKSGLAEAAANTAKTNAQTAIDDAQSALTTAGNAKTTADTLSIKVDDLEGEVELKASQTEVDGISGTVSTHTTTLSQHATAISSKAESELVDTIKGTVDTHTTEISQNATDIASKANTATVNTLTGRVDTAESNISQNATAITQRVTTTTYNTGIANKENTVLKQTTAPTHMNGRLWLDTSVTPNILKRSNGTTWIKATPTTPGEVGAYSQSDGAGLAGRLTTAETNITQTATAITSKADKSTVDTLAGTVSTQGTTITQQAELIASKASQTEVDTVKGTVAGHTTTISQHATQIASKAETNLVNVIKGTVDNHTTEISQNATDIASKANSSSVNTLTGRVSTAETTISQHATAITSKASQEEVDTVKGTVTGHTTTLSQHASQISSKAESSLVNAIKGTVDTHTTEISQNATDIASKASSSSVNTLTGRVSTAETSISQNATAITSKASQSEVDTVKGTVSNHTTQISQNAEAITSRLTSAQVDSLVDGKGLAQVTYVDNQINATAESFGVELTRVEGKIPTEIGGRNLLRNSKERILRPSSSDFNYTTLSYPTVDGQTYTMSADVEITDGALSRISVLLNYGNTGADGFQFPIESGKITVTYVAHDTMDNNRILLYAGTSGNTSGNGVIFRNIKIEKGNVITDWTPAPEDTMMENDFTVFKNSYQSTVDSINTELSKTAKITDLDGMVTESVLATKQFVTAGSMATTLSNYAQVNNVPTNNQFNTLKNRYDSMEQTIGTNGNKIAQMVMTDSSFRTTVSDMDIKSRLGTGKVLSDDPTFEKGYNGVGLYNNRHNGTVVMTRENSPSGTHPTDSPWRLKFTHTGTATPGYGGFLRLTDSRANAEFVIRFSALIPAGRRLVATSNSLGTGGTINWITSREGTGNWEEYAYHVKSGKTGTFSSFGHTYIDAIGAQPTVSAPLIWYIAKLEIIDISSSQQSQITQLADSWALTLKSGNDVKTQINASTNSIRLASKFIHLSGTSLIDNTVIKSAHIDSLNANKITGNTADFNTIRAGVLTTDAVTATHIKSDTALIDNIFATQALVDRLWAKAIWTNKITAMEIDAGKITSGIINAARLNVTDLRSKILTANVIDATQINGSTALFDKLFSTISATNRLVAQGAWITNANIVSLNANKITAGTISADRISTSSLSNIEIGGRNLLKNTSGELKSISKEGWDWDTHNFNQNDLNRLNIGVGDELTLSVYLDKPSQDARAFIQFTLAGPTYRQNYGNYVLQGQSGWSVLTIKITSADLNNFYTMSVAIRGTGNSSGTVRISNKKLEKGNISTGWSPAPEDIVNDLSSHGRVDIHGGNIKADTLDVGAITGDLGEFINLSLKAQNSQASLSGSSFKIESIANSQSYIEMSNVPEIRARSANSSMVVMGQGLTNYSVDNIERFYMGTKIDGTQHGIMIRKNHGWAIMRESDSFGGTPAKYYTVKSGQQRVAVVEALMRDSTVTEVPTGNETQFIINNNYLARLNGFSTSTSSTIAAPWPTLTTGQLIKYAEGTPGNQSGKQSIFKVWTANNTSVSAFDAHVTFNTGYSGASDRRIKHNIQDTSVEALSHINSLKFKEFKYNSDNRYEPLGIIAQDSGILRVKWEEMESIDIQRSIMLGLKGVQELHAKVKEQAEEIKQLKEIINQ